MTIAIAPHTLRAGVVGLVIALLAVLVPAPSADAYPAGQVYVQDGRFVQDGAPTVLKGVNVEVQEHFVRSDFQRMADDGFNMVRLRVHWATLQPQPPVRRADGGWDRSWDQEMLSRITDYIGWAHQAGMVTLVDNHDCKWCTDWWYPEWTAKKHYNSAANTYGRTASAVQRYHTDGWTDSLRTQHMGAYLEWLAGQLRGVPGIVGYEVLNEPPPGSLPPTAQTSALMSQVQLSWARRIRRADPDRVIVFQTRYGFLPGLRSANLQGWADLGNVAADLHNGFGARWGVGIQAEEGRDDHGEVLQKVNNNITSATVAPYSGTSVAQRNHLLERIETLEPFGIPLMVGEWGEGPVSAMANHGSIIAAMCSIGDARISWAHRDWQGPRGVHANDGSRSPWGDLVAAAASSDCAGD